MPIEYLAGIVDGEGHFCRHKHANGRGVKYGRSRLIVSNTHLPLLEAIHNSFGGFVRKVNVVSPISRKQIYHWIIEGTDCETLARQMLPHLIVKQEQVKIVLEYERKPDKRLGKQSPEHIAKRVASRKANALTN